MKQEKKRTSLSSSFSINALGGKTTKELFESNGIAWADEYEDEENMNAFGDPSLEEDLENE